MMQGCIGAVEFAVSPEEVFTWRSMDRKRTICFGEHRVVEGRPRLQYTGRDLDTVSLVVVMDSALPGAPSCERRIEELTALAEGGEEQALVFGATYQGLWVITAVHVTGRMMRGNRMVRADVTVELKEYN